MITSPYYVKNPDVVLREEDADGGLLFNPDTNQLRVINSTGLFVWSMCDGTHNLSAIVDALKEQFDNVPEDRAAEDVKVFIEQLSTMQFVGVSENKG